MKPPKPEAFVLESIIALCTTLIDEANRLGEIERRQLLVQRPPEHVAKILIPRPISKSRGEEILRSTSLEVRNNL